MSALYPAAFERLTAMLEALEPEIKNMTGASPGFVRDMTERVARYGERTYVSPKQISWLESLYEKHVGSLDALGEAPDPQQGARDDLLGNGRDEMDDEIPF